MAEQAEAVYKPESKIVVALSFEGLVNDGVTECGLTASNAWGAVEPGRHLFGRTVEAEEVGIVAETREMQAFHRLRPVVEVAEDYLTVERIIAENPALVDALLANTTEETVAPLAEKFEADKSVTTELRAAFKKAFYAERTRAQGRNYQAWLAAQSPFPDAVEELRLMRDTWATEQDGDKVYVVAGFVPVFATSKDEKSTWELCTFYGSQGRLRQEDIGEGIRCVITKGRIIGKETTTDKIDQLRQFAGREEVPYSQVWRVNDRVDPKQQAALARAGFGYQFFVEGGYAFPHEARKAREDPHLVVVPRRGLAVALGQYAKKLNF